MKILATADWHLGDFNGPSKDGKNLRAQDTIKCLEYLCTVAESEHPDLILVSGDIFHQAKVWSSRGLKEVGTAIRIINRLGEAAKHVVIMRGTPNHDGDEQFQMLAQEYEALPFVTVVTSPEVIEQNGYSIALIPGFDRDQFRAAHPGLSKEEEHEVFTQDISNLCIGLRAQMDETGKHILMAHYTVPGANMESGQTAFFGNSEPMLTREALLTADYDLVALGHIHRPQSIEGLRNVFYSGAVNALNFNDEAQPRGFWIHEFVGDNCYHRLIETPYRRFLTIHLDDMHISNINAGLGFITLHDVTDKIVRVLYSCTEANRKALNKSALEKQLYDLGAFYVSEISPEKTTEAADTKRLSVATDPEENLIKYLRDRNFSDDDISRLVPLARPIMQEALASTSAGEHHGVFTPLEIEVKNYRNYVSEKFDFRNISFCTINGQNGAGKSSLFMDAILDCLYEEPREGDLTGWIRSDEKAKSGSISLTFSIGDETYRVTRTRTKSGKATLNISQEENGEWVGRSAERVKDTQQLIIDLLGMDSRTFKACALIMQDQYGLFLQSSKEERMEVLEKLLGLGIYGAMEASARQSGKEFGAKTKELKTQIETLEDSARQYMVPAGAIEDKNKELESADEEKKALNAQLDEQKAKAAVLQAASDRAEKLARKKNDVLYQRQRLENSRTAAIDNKQACEKYLANEPFIVERCEKYRTLTDEAADLNTGASRYTESQRQVRYLHERKLNKADAEIVAKQKMNLAKSKYESSLMTEDDCIYEMRYADLVNARKDLAKLDEQQRQYREAKNRFDQLLSRKSVIEAENRMKLSGLTSKKSYFESQVATLGQSGCHDIENAACKFLANAQEARKQLPGIVEEIRKADADYNAALESIQDQIAEAKKAIPDYSASIHMEVQEKVSKLSVYEAKHNALEARKASSEGLKAAYELAKENYEAAVKAAAEAADEEQKAIEAAEQYKQASEDYEKKMNEAMSLKSYLEMEKNIPVYRERLANLEQQINDLTDRILQMTTEIMDIDKDVIAESEASAGLSDQLFMIRQTEMRIRSIDGNIATITADIAVMQHKADELNRVRVKIDAISKEKTAAAALTANYDILKLAFSQDGIPHQIVMTILPHLAETANNILGQMTGGKMGIEFKTEKVMKSNKKEVATLDVLIEESGKTALPYLSKSGGEKVKSSLAVVLALAEIKSSSAGISLGMLFIDEPPFLDEDGMSAYCDALETIQCRYPDIKIMAITHDQAMKSRFPQSVDIIKTEEGSKVA